MTTETMLPTITVDTAVYDLVDHAHRWILDEPNGPVSNAVCRRCGAERRFRNWLDEIDFITTDDERRAA